MWSQPWGYREAFAFSLGLLLLGVVSHLLFGTISSFAWAFPWNLIGGILLLFLSVITALLARKFLVAYFFCTHKAAIAGMVVWGLCLLFMGLTRQIDPELIPAHGMHSLVHRLGWSHILSTRYFLYLYLYVLFLLGSTTCYNLLAGKRKRPRPYYLSFLLNHLGLYIALWSGLLGVPQIERYEMQVDSEAEYPEWRVKKSKSEELIPMDFAIALK